ncbi:retrovirus-related pol polyprotein from transposon TNT 1-94 [Tanacetum coccineum]
MLAVCNTVVPNVPKAPKPSSNAKRDPQGTKPGAKPGHKKHSTSLTQPSVSSSEATKGRSSKRPTSSKTGHLKRKKESSSAMDSNPSQTSASTSVVAEMHKEDQQATGASALKINPAPAEKLKHVKTKDDFSLSIVMKELNDLKLQINKNQSSYSRDNNSQQCDIRKPICYMNSRCLRHMTGVKSYLHKYEEQPGPKVVFGYDSTCTTEGYGSIKCNGIVFTKVAFVNGLKYNLISISQLCDAKYSVQFDEKRGTIFNSNKEIFMIAPRVRDVYVLNMTSSAQESCFFAKASDNLNWIWNKILTHLNFKTINKLAKQNLVIGLPLLVYSKDKPCSLCEKGKHHKANFKTKQTFSI